MLSITRSNVGAATSYYYYFYDWEIEHTNVCGRVAVEAIINTTQISADFSSQSINSNSFSFTDASISADSWRWSFGDGAISTNKNPQHIYGQTGTYQVQLIATDAFGCSDTITREIRVDEISAVPDLPLFEKLKIYPNPAKDVLRVEIAMNESKYIEVILYNTLGEKILQEEESGDQISLVLPVSDLPPSVYYVRIRDGQSTEVVKRFVKVD